MRKTFTLPLTAVADFLFCFVREFSVLSFLFHTDCVLFINISKFGKVSKSSKIYFHPLTKQASRNEQCVGFHTYLPEELQEGGYHRNILTPPPLPQPRYKIYSQTAELKRCKNIASKLFYCLNILSKAVRDFDCAAYSKGETFRFLLFSYRVED